MPLTVCGSILARLLEDNLFLVTPDEKSRYDHVWLSCDSQGYWGLQFGGYIIVYTYLSVQGIALYLPNCWNSSNILFSEFVFKHSSVHS